MDKIYYQMKQVYGKPFGTFANFPAFNLFSTRGSENAKDEKFIRWLRCKTKRGISYLNQIHSSQILTAKTDGNQGEGDGLILTDKLLGAVFTADCLPIIFADRASAHLAVVHAGWKGSLEGIALKAVEALKEKGAREIVVAIGPSARSCCYEIGQDLYEKFLYAWPELTTKIILKNNNKLFLDLSSFHRLLLGGAVAEIYDSRQCTICSRDYYSYRKNKTSNRQICVLGRRI